MIHYHGTPISGKRTDAAEFLLGRHALVSFYRPDDLSIVLETCQSFCLDNGAFSEWNKSGNPIDFDAYVDWVLSVSRHPSFDWCLIPDIIGGTEQENCDLVAKWLRMAPNAKGVPVFHMHESLEWLSWLCDNFDTVALGSSGEWQTPGTQSWWHRMAEMMEVICDDRGWPKCKLHGLRMLDPDIFTRLPLSSADSTNAGVNAGSTTRCYIAPTAGQRASVIAARIEIHNSAAVWEGQHQSKLF